MPAGIDVVQRVENNVEALVPSDIERGIFDVGMMRLYPDIRIELSG